MKQVFVVCALLAGAFALPGGAASTCEGQVIDLAGVAYYVLIGPSPDNGWGYLETNGEPGLQRGGVAIHGGMDPCQESATPDTAFY